MSNTFLLTLPLILPLAAGILGLLLMRVRGLPALVAILGAVVQFVVACMLVVAADREGYIVVQAGGWPAPFGISLVADRLAAIMVAISALVGVAVFVHALANRERGLPLALFYPLSNFLLLGVNGSFLTGDLFNLYVWFEVMLIASFVLMTLGGSKAQIDGGFKYVIINLFASAMFLVGVGILYGKLGTLNMADIARTMAGAEDPLLLNTTAVLLLVAFGVKAGIFPFFFWLPASYHTPAIVVSGLFAALLTKVGVYAMARAQLLLFAPNFPSMQLLLAVLAAATMVTGVLGAASMFHTRRILAFHIISQIGYMLMGFVLGTPLAVAGAVFYLIHHILVKTNLFFVAGLIRRQGGSEDLGRLGGLAKASPWLAVLFLIPALSLAGIPPLSGFWAKLIVVKASFEAGFHWLAAVALGVGLLTLFSMTKIWQEAFWKAAPDKVGGEDGREDEGKPGVFACSAVIVFASITVLIGVTVTPLLDYSKRAAAQLLDPSSYIRAVLDTNDGTMSQQSEMR